MGACGIPGWPCEPKSASTSQQTSLRGSSQASVRSKAYLLLSLGLLLLAWLRLLRLLLLLGLTLLLRLPCGLLLSLNGHRHLHALTPRHAWWHHASHHPSPLVGAKTSDVSILFSTDSSVAQRSGNIREALGVRESYLSGLRGDGRWRDAMQSLGRCLHKITIVRESGPVCYLIAHATNCMTVQKLTMPGQRQRCVVLTMAGM